MTEETTRPRVCPLCEATCGLAITTRGRDVLAIRGDDEDVFSRGYLCPKATALAHLEADPDRLRRPLVRRGTQWREVSWEDAYAEIERRLPPLIAARGRDAVGVYLGNPSAHHLTLQLYPRVLIRALGTPNVFSASTVDQMPKHVSAGLMFGTPLSIPVPDLDRTDFLLMLGANPLVSNGSLMTAPDVRGRLRAIRERGGAVVVVDPKRTETARAADEHVAIRPGTDALFLFALAHVLVREDLAAPGRLAEHTAGFETVAGLARDFPPETVGPVCGIEAAAIEALARRLAAARRAAVYGRLGTCTQEFGTLASWLIDVLNVLTGNLDRAGGAMFPKAAAGAANTHGEPGRGRGFRTGRRHSRVRRAPEVLGEFPAACLAEEIDTPGAGQIRALVTIAGNPVLSTPNAARLDRALGSLEFMLSFDIYLNETTRHAHVILPGLSALEQPHYDLALRQLAVRNVATYSPALFAPPPAQRPEWESLLTVAGIVLGQGAGADPAALDEFVVRQQIDGILKAPASPLAGRTPDDVLAALAPRRGPERLLDLLLRTGPYGDAIGAHPDGLSLAALEARPHGIDLGPLQPRVPEVLRTPSGKIELAPEPLLADVPRLRTLLHRPRPPFALIGRRQLRSNNSWLHNVESMVRGRERCTLELHPDDAARLGLRDGGTAELRSRVGTLRASVKVTAAMMPGVVSLPHGWGHDLPGVRQRVAVRHAGVNSNLLADDAGCDPLSGNAVLCGIPVEIAPVGAAPTASVP
jgi:anaerobic selenocysteine-containing dehydrogenase